MLSTRKTFLDERAKVGVFVGYDWFSRSYKVYNPITKRIVRTSDCIFKEDEFPLASALQRAQPPSNDDELSGVHRGLWGQRDEDATPQQVQPGNDADGSLEDKIPQITTAKV